MRRTTEPAEIERLLRRACEYEAAGNFRAAFRIYLAVAKKEDSCGQVNLGNFYCYGIGVKRNRERAAYWYGRAYRQHDCCAAHHIGILYRNEKKFERAIFWFERAVALDDQESNLEVAKVLLQLGDKKATARRLKRVCTAKPYIEVTADGRDEARKLLDGLR